MRQRIKVQSDAGYEQIHEEDDDACAVRFNAVAVPSSRVSFPMQQSSLSGYRDSARSSARAPRRVFARE